MSTPSNGEMIARGCRPGECDPLCPGPPSHGKDPYGKALTIFYLIVYVLVPAVVLAIALGGCTPMEVPKAPQEINCKDYRRYYCVGMPAPTLTARMLEVAEELGRTAHAHGQICSKVADEFGIDWEVRK